MNDPKSCPTCCKPDAVLVLRSRGIKVGRVRVMECSSCGLRWRSIEMTASFLRDTLLRDPEAVADLLRVIG